MSTTTGKYDLAREDGDGAVLSIDFHGALLPHDVDVALAHITAEPDEFGMEDEGSVYRGFNVEVMLRRSVYDAEFERRRALGLPERLVLA